MGRNEQGTERRRARERAGERAGEREWERDPQSKRRRLTGAKGGWWVRADQGVWDGMAAQSSLMVKQRGAIAPLEHRRDTSLRVEQPKHDKGCENAAHVRVMAASGHENVQAECARMVWC